MREAPSIAEFQRELKKRNTEAAGRPVEDQLDDLRHDVLILQLGFRSITRTLEKFLKVLERSGVPVPEHDPGPPPPPPEAA